MIKREPARIAVIGMAGRFPGANNVATLWKNLETGTESISHFSDEELAKSEYAFDEVIKEPGYVKSRGVLEDVDMFDADFFGFKPREAASLDPQQRIWFECAWEALENAGVAPAKHKGKIGVYAGSGYLNTYLLHNICSNRDSIEELIRLRAVDSFQNIINNDKDFLPTRTSYLFGLTGPSINIQTSCSTSLVAVVQATQSLLLGESDVCLAGGISIQFPQVRGYLSQDGGMESPDGHIRVFDEKANGTVFSNGVGIVVLKRLDDAKKDGHRILAILDGYGLNNDGFSKASYIAPSADGQADVVRQAQTMSGYHPETITYVEAHGTGTSMGDPIEVDALSRVFREKTGKKQFCGIGSVKSNLGHLDSAAGIAGLIKTILAMQHRVFPPTINYQTPNSCIDFSNSPFYVTDKLTPWHVKDFPRRAGISSFGVGGTNVHVIIEEAPTNKSTKKSVDWQLIALSAKSKDALEQKTAELATHMQSSDDRLCDIAFSLMAGRADMRYRRFMISRDITDTVATLKPVDIKRVVTREVAEKPKAIVYMFPGQGSQHINMLRDLYNSEPLVKQILDDCAEKLTLLLELDIRELLYPKQDADKSEMVMRLTQTSIAQPVLFVIEYTLAKLWMQWGIKPAAMIGHSVGEYTAACLAGVMSLDDTLLLLSERGKLMQAQPPGNMLAVREHVDTLKPLLSGSLCLAAANSPELTVASGPSDEIAALVKVCNSKNIDTTLLHTSHAFHSTMMDGVLAPFRDTVNKIKLSPPKFPIMSSCTGNWLQDDEATNAEYWTCQLRQPVLFGAGIESLKTLEKPLFLEVGPGTNLSTFTRQCCDRGSISVINSLAHPKDERSDRAQLLDAVGRLWLNDVSIKPQLFFANQQCQHVALPTYPFQRKRHWIDPPTTQIPLVASHSAIPIQQTQLTQLVQQSTTDMAPTNQPVQSRIPVIRDYLIKMISDLSGEDYTEEDLQLTFVELGFDSLFLTQVSTEIQNKLGVKLRFRRMLEDLSTIETMTAFFDKTLPPEQLAIEIEAAANTQQTPSAVSAMPAMPTTAINTPVVTQHPQMAEVTPVQASAAERLIHNQLEIMQHQLDVIKGISAQATIPTSSPTAITATEQVPQATIITKTTPIPKVNPAGSRSLKAEPSTKPKAFGAQARIDTSNSDVMTTQQRVAYETFTKRYLAKTGKSKEFTQKNRKSMADPRVATGFQPILKEIVFPIVIERSKGSRLWDIDGNEYVELTCGFGSNFLGNQPDFITAALHEQIEKGYEVGPQHPLAADVTNLICELTGAERVAFCNTGSEAVMGAMRQARTITGRSLVAIFTNSYHGIFDEVIVRGTKKLRSIAAAPGILASAVENVLVLDYGTPETLKILWEHGPKLAAIMAEPVQSRNPKLQPREFLQELRKICDKNDAALIFDEVITGFRIEPGGAQAHFGVKADLATYGKIIGGGLPFAAIAGNSKFMDALDGGHWEFGDNSYPEVGVTYFAGTFVRHPLALAAAKASLEYLKNEGPELQRRLNERVTAFVNELNTFFISVSAPIKIDHFGSLCRITVFEEEQFGSLLYYYLRDRNVHIWEGFGCFLTSAHTKEDIALIVNAFKDSVTELQQGGLMSGAAPATDLSAIGDSLSGFPLTEAQREIWHASQMGERASCAYNESFTWELHGELDVEKFHRAIDVVNARHEALRLRFSQDGDHQYLVNAEPLPLPLFDWSSRSIAEQELDWKQVLIDHATRPFDMEKGPLILNELYKKDSNNHVLVSTAHHIVFDGWSAGVYIDEISKIYSAQVESESIDLPAVPSFLSYIDNEIKAAASSEGQTALAYWHKAFATKIDPLNLPGDRPYPRSKSFEGSSVHWEIKSSTYESIRAVAMTQNSTLYSLMLATYYALLNRITQQTDIVVGIPTAGQAIVGEYSLIGHCVNILPLRAKPLPGDKFTNFLCEISKSVYDAQDHQPATFGSILREANISRIPGRSPLVEVIFNLNRKLPEDKLAGLQTRINEVRKQAINWDMFLNCSEEEGILTIDCDYNTDILDETTIRKWLGIYESMLDAIVENPSVLIQDLPLLTANETEMFKQLSIGHQQALSEPSVPDMVRKQAEATPDHVAVEWDGEKLSYSELVSLVNQIAHYLTSTGVTKGAGVGVCLSRTPLLPAILLGIQSTGGYYVPIDPNYPVSRIKYIVQDASLGYVITDPEVSDIVRFEDCKKIVLDTKTKKLIQKQPSTKLHELTPDHIAYVIYTSGSTGNPKGVCTPQSALVNFLQSMKNEPGIRAEDKLLAITTLSFDIAGLELMLPLTVGATVLITPDNLSEDPDALANCIATMDVTIMQATPTHWRTLLDTGWVGKDNLHILVGGEVLQPELATEMLHKCAELWNMYGPTESTIWSTCHRVIETDLSGPIPIGKPIANTSAYVLDKQGSLCPMGVPGELYIGGTGLALGYLHNPKLTEEYFIEKSLANETSERLYRTGDLCRWTQKGLLDYLGRIDDQVKIRGHRIELGELEFNLVAHDTVKAAIASRWEPTPGDARLIAHVQPVDGSNIDNIKLRDFLHAHVPDYMIPQHILSVSEFPVTPNGKVDRKLLPYPDYSGSNSISHTAPATELEEKIIIIWKEILGTSEIGTQDDFFDLGGHSILAIKVLSRLRKEIEPALTLRQVFENPTIEQVARKVQSLALIRSAQSDNGLDDSDREVSIF